MAKQYHAAAIIVTYAQTPEFRNVVAHWTRDTTLGTTNKIVSHLAPRQMRAFRTSTK
jgi:hypothetical protein